MDIVLIVVQKLYIIGKKNKKIERRFKMKRLINPDQNKIYHVWHYCVKCGKTWTHSQGDFDSLKKHECFLNLNVGETSPFYFKTISTKIDVVIIN